MKRTDYVMTYFHPRDFDPQQSVIAELSKIRKFKSYYEFDNALKKLEKLMDNFEFVDLKSADQCIDWNTVKTIKLDN